jgi:hypothetical protein
MSDDEISASPEISALINTANDRGAAGDAAGRSAAATAALTAWADRMRTTPPANPTTPVESGQRLEALSKDATWRDKFFSGDVATRREFELLTTTVATADPVSLAIGGVTPPDGLDENAGALPGPREQVAGVQHLRELGFTNANVEEIYRGELRHDDGGKLDEAATAMRVAEAEQWINRATKDAEFRKRLLSGDQEAAAQLHRASAIIAAGKK